MRKAATLGKQIVWKVVFVYHNLSMAIKFCGPIQVLYFLLKPEDGQ